jgi:hypothetical protein
MIKIYAHHDKRGQIVSIHEKNQHNIFPSIKSDSIVKYGWTTDIFVQQLKQLPNSENYFEICPWSEQIPIAEQGYYLMHYGNDIQASQHYGFITLPPIIVDQINDGVLTLLVVLVYEAFGALSLAQWQTDFCTHLNFLGIQRHGSVKVVLGSYSPTMQRHEDRRVAWIFYPWFEAALQSQIKASGNITVPRDPLLKKKYKFLSLNKRPRPQRFLFTAWLEYFQLTHHGYISWPLTHGRTLDELTTNPLYSCGLKFFPSMERHVRDTNKIIGCYPDADKFQGTDWLSSAPLYNDVDFEIVNETHHQNIGDNIFLTEKTFRAIYMGVPFMICGNPGSLELLRMLGYKTFPSVFDEHYDKIMSPVLAINHVVMETRKHANNNLPLSGFAHDEILQATNHNQQLFLSKQHAQNIFEVIQKSYS